jgi:FkbM family methyltransferase
MIYTSTLAARALNRLGLLDVIRTGYKLNINGKAFKIPVIENKEGFIYHLGVMEPFFFEVLKKLYSHKNYQFLDVGVNFGQTLLKVKAINPSAKYFGFEPSGLCSYYASQLIRVNGFSNAQIIRTALSDTSGILTLQAPSEGDTRATIIEDEQSVNNGYKELVPAIPLDSMMHLITEVKDSILKVDVEGAEMMVFKGAEKYIDSYRPVLLFENLPSRNEAPKIAEQAAISDFFTGKKYRLFAIDELKKKVSPIDSIINPDDMQITNYMAVPAEDSALVAVFA